MLYEGEHDLCKSVGELIENGLYLCGVLIGMVEVDHRFYAGNGYTGNLMEFLFEPACRYEVFGNTSAEGIVPQLAADGYTWTIGGIAAIDNKAGAETGAEGYADQVTCLFTSETPGSHTEAGRIVGKTDVAGLDTGDAMQFGPDVDTFDRSEFVLGLGNATDKIEGRGNSDTQSGDGACASFLHTFA